MAVGSSQRYRKGVRIVRALVTILLLFVLLGWVIVQDAALAAGFRCGTKLVSVDDTKLEVRYKCGEPASIETWTEERSRYLHYRLKPGDDRHTGKKGYRSRGHGKKTYVNVEEWTYNLGPSRFMRLLRFENGKLKKLETGGYGF